MSRKRIYADRAEQMRAYRQRQKERQPAADPVVSPRPASRPVRLRRVIDMVQALHADYEAWQDSMPASLAESPTGQRLAETVEQLAEVVDLLESIDPPKGYGRD